MTNHYERGQFDSSRPAFKLNWYRSTGLFLLGLSTGLMLTLTYRVLFSNESDLKRALLKSLVMQGGVGFRMEDRFAIGRPDMYMHAVGLPPFLVEAKIVHGAKLTCTPMQAERLNDLHRPPHALAVIIGLKDRHLFIGYREQPIAGCIFIHAPPRLLSAEWEISRLLRMQVDATINVP